ncbi:MAG: beta-ketoacyl-[Bacteroidales bacterium]|nr:beta-ketoacyl-[acyl-carrier-protein] synthase family protein [Bacteroidales bacterium]
DFPVGEAPLSNAELSARTGAPETWPRTTLLSILALQEALEQAKIVEGITLPDSLMLVSGTTVGGMDLSEKLYPAYSPWHSCGASTDLAAQFLGFSHATTLSTACSSAANAFIYAANLIRCGLAQRVVAGGAESLSDYHLNGFNSLMILDREWCRPFDASRAGLNLGEGAAFLVLETEESALERGAKPIAVLSGWGNACDAFHQTASSENGEGAFLAMSQALNRAGLKPSDIDYVNAHGTGTPNNDASESTALRRIFGDSLPPVSSTKPFTGHTTSASGSIEAVFCLLALQHGFLPPELNWKEADPACVTPYRSFGLRPQDDKCHSERSEESLRHILSNAFGFGGNDSSIILSRV